MAAEQARKRFGGFEIIGELGRGAQGRILEARCIEPDAAMPKLAEGMTVALKRMRVEEVDSDVFKHLRKRTVSLEQISHPNVVAYYGCFARQDDDEHWHVVVMEPLHGCTLRDRMKRASRGLDADVVVRVFHDCLAGLACAAEHGIIHRDIKPSNIFLCDDGTTKLIDFELARHATGTQTGAGQGSMRGTIPYMAPEFHPSFRPHPDFRGDAVSDIFSLAVCLFEALAGHLPYANAKSTAVEDEMMAFFDRWGGPAGATGALVDIGKQRALHPLVHIEALLGKGLAIRRDDRFATYAEMQQMYERVKPREIAHGANRYTLLQVIGHGGFGEVFKARRERDGLHVAIKVLTADTQSERFAREARLLADAADSRIVQFIEFIAVSQLDAARYFLVMELLPGMPGWSLRDRLAGAQHSGLPIDEVLAIFQRYAQALAILHRQGILHRDIKPSNLYAPADNPDNAKIMDLGIARDEKDPSVGSRGIPGTPDYWPPETLTSGHRGDPRMDIYALGLCLFEALTGHTAFPRLPRASDLAFQAFIERARSRPVPALDDAIITSRPQLLQLLHGMLDPDPDFRIADAEKVAGALRTLQHAPQASAGTAEAGPAVDAAAADSEAETYWLDEAAIARPRSAGPALPPPDGNAALPSAEGEAPTTPAEDFEPLSANPIEPPAAYDAPTTPAEPDVLTPVEPVMAAPPPARVVVDAEIATAKAVEVKITPAKAAAAELPRPVTAPAPLRPQPSVAAATRPSADRTRWRRHLRAASVAALFLAGAGLAACTLPGLFRERAREAMVQRVAGLQQAAPSATAAGIPSLAADFAKALEKCRQKAESDSWPKWHELESQLQAAAGDALTAISNEFTHIAIDDTNRLHSARDNWAACERQAPILHWDEGGRWNALLSVMSSRIELADFGANLGGACDAVREATLGTPAGLERWERLAAICERGRASPTLAACWRQELTAATNRTALAVATYCKTARDDIDTKAYGEGLDLIMRAAPAVMRQGGTEIRTTRKIVADNATKVRTKLVVDFGDATDAPPVCVEWRAATGTNWTTVENNTAVAPGPIQVRFSRKDFLLTGVSDKLDRTVSDHEACGIRVPGKASWKRSAALDLLRQLQIGVNAQDWKVCEELVRTQPPLEDSQNVNAWNEKVDEVKRHVRRVQELVAAFDSAARALRTDAPWQPDTLKPFVGPEAAALREDPEAGRALTAFSNAVADCVSAACGREPLETRGKRLDAAGQALAADVLKPLLGDKMLAVLAEKVRDEQSKFVLSITNQFTERIDLTVDGQDVGAVEPGAGLVYVKALKADGPARSFQVDAHGSEAYEPTNQTVLPTRSGGQRLAFRACDLPLRRVLLHAEPAGAIQPPASAVLEVSGGDPMAMDGKDRLVLPGKHTVRYMRTDYNPVVRERDIRPAQGRASVPAPGAGEWQPVPELAQLQKAAADWQAGNDQGVLAAMAANWTPGWSGDVDLQRRVFGEVTESCRRRVATWLEQTVRTTAESNAWSFQVADPSYDARFQMRRDDKASCPRPPPKPVLPNAIISRLPADLVSQWRDPPPDNPAHAKGWAILKEAHEHYRLAHEAGDDFPAKPVALLDEAVKAGAEPNIYDLQMGLYALYRCQLTADADRAPGVGRTQDLSQGHGPTKIDDKPLLEAKDHVKHVFEAVPASLKAETAALVRTRVSDAAGRKWMLEQPELQGPK